jgi:hypothetical protein
MRLLCWIDANEQSVFKGTIFWKKSFQLRQVSQLLRPPKSVGVNHIHAKVSLLRLFDIDVLHVTWVMSLIRAVRYIDEISRCEHLLVDFALRETAKVLNLAVAAWRANEACVVFPALFQNQISCNAASMQ